MVAGLGDGIILSGDDDMDQGESSEAPESIAKRNMIALSLQNETEEEEEVDNFIGKSCYTQTSA